MAETPGGSGNRPLLCPKCGTGNPPEVTACLYCGETLAPRTKPQPMALGPRLLVSLAAGLLVLLTVTYASLAQYRDWAARRPQERTLLAILAVREAVDQYRKDKGSPPGSLDDLAGTHWSFGDRNGYPVDGWWRLLHYQAKGDGYRIVSYGRDGKPGGVGLDYDLSSDHLGGGGGPDLSWVLSRIPPQARPTFGQFATDRESRAMALLSLLSGLAAFTLAFRVLGNTRKSSLSLVLQLLVTLVATVVLGFIITTVHLPSGH